METKKKILNKLQGTEKVREEFEGLLERDNLITLELTPYYTITEEGEVFIDEDSILEDCYERIRNLRELAEEQNE
jgi:hypothetical protein